MAATRRTSAQRGTQRLPALTIVSGAEEFLVSRAVARTLSRARALDPDTELREVAGGDPAAANLVLMAVSPSLFGAAAVVVITGLEDAAEATIGTVADAAEQLSPGTYLVAIHNGVRNRKHLDRLRQCRPAGGVGEVDCAQVKRGRPTIDFLKAEAERYRRNLTSDGAEALVQCIGTDIGLLVGALEQMLTDDPADPLTHENVAAVMRGVAEVSGFQVADAVWDRDPTLAVGSLRWGLQTSSISGPAVVGSLAAGLRALIKVGSCGPAMSDADVAQLTGVPLFKVRQLRAVARRWDRASLSRALVELADVDAATKGGLQLGQALDPVQKNHVLDGWVRRTAGPRDAGR